MSVLEDKIDKLSKKVDQLTKLVKLGVAVDKAGLIQGGMIMAVLDDLETEVNDTASGIDSAIVLLDGLAAKLDAAVASGDPARVTAVIAAIKAKKEALAAAVMADARP